MSDADFYRYIESMNGGHDYSDDDFDEGGWDYAEEEDD